MAAPGRAVCLVIVGGVLGSVAPALAQSTIIHTRKPPSEIWSPLHPLTIGASVEFETEHPTTEIEVPVTVDYNVSRYLLVHLEPQFGYIDTDKSDIGGLGDTETSVEYEFLHERRYTPSLTSQAGIRWPTASHAALGEPGIDYFLGLDLNKDLVYFELDSNLVFTFASSYQVQNSFEASLAVEVPLTHHFDLLAEVVRTMDAGPVKENGSADLTEGTLGWAWHPSAFTTLEQGFTVRSDGTWQLILGWQYSFGGD